MKAFITMSFILAALFGTLVAAGARAQGGPALTFKVSTPFIAGDAKFPAGTYTIRQEPESDQEFEISSDSKALSAFLATYQGDPIAPGEKMEVTFQKYGNTLILKGFAIPGLPKAFVVQESYAEKKAAKTGTPTKVTAPAEKK
ncbi:MAG: hypothetical protein WAM58_19685 [Candidatus Acidiferrum sp.]